jgi:hypothetical protein
MFDRRISFDFQVFKNQRENWISCSSTSSSYTKHISSRARLESVTKTIEVEGVWGSARKSIRLRGFGTSFPEIAADNVMAGFTFADSVVTWRKLGCLTTDLIKNTNPFCGPFR